MYTLNNQVLCQYSTKNKVPTCIYTTEANLQEKVSRLQTLQEQTQARILSATNQQKVENEEKLISAANVAHNSPARMPRENFIKMVRHYFSQSERSGLVTNIKQVYF